MRKEKNEFIECYTVCLCRVDIIGECELLVDSFACSRIRFARCAALSRVSIYLATRSHAMILVYRACLQFTAVNDRLT